LRIFYFRVPAAFRTMTISEGTVGVEALIMTVFTLYYKSAQVQSVIK